MPKYKMISYAGNDILLFEILVNINYKNRTL